MKQINRDYLKTKLYKNSFFLLSFLNQLESLFACIKRTKIVWRMLVICITK